MVWYVAGAAAAWWLSRRKGAVIDTAPKVAGLRFQTSTYGRAIALVYGKTRISPNFIDYDDFVAIKHKQSSGGKGGGVTSTSYTYRAAILMALCEGPIANVTRVWIDKAESSLAALGLTLFAGDYAQNPFGYWSTNHPDKALAYRGQAYLATGSYDLGASESPPNHTFEVEALLPYSGSIRDALVPEIAFDLLCNEDRALGLPVSLIQSSLGRYWPSWTDYSIAAGFFLSPAYTEQKEARELVSNLASLTNTALFMSEGILKAVPFADAPVSGNGVTFTPNVTPVYDLTLDDFLTNGDEPPIRIRRSTQADAYNHVQVSFLNRNNSYNEDVAEAKDDADIDRHGLRSMPIIDAPEICEPIYARNLAQSALQRALYVRNEFQFTLGWKYILLEQMDIVTLTSADQDLHRLPVRIKTIEENEDGDLSITAEEYLGGIANWTQYPNQEAGGYAADYNAEPGNSNAPVIIEPPENLAVSALELWIYASGGELWGGCEVWVSSDDVSYTRLTTIETAARQGVLTAVLATSTDDPDAVHTLSVNTGMSKAQILSGSQTDVDAFNTLCYVDGELIAYRDSNLVGTNQYSLSYLRRGVYNSPVSSHAIGSQFVRMDADVAAKYPFDTGRIGSQIYIKLVSFNIWGGGLQDISAVPKYTYTITGAAMNSPPDDAANLHTNFVAERLTLYWDEVADFRTIEYEIRTGPTWDTAAIIGRTSLPKYTLPGNATFWIATVAYGANGQAIYSTTPQSIVATGATIVKNVIATWDEAATGWSGTFTGGAQNSGGILQLASSGQFLAIPDFLAQTDILHFGDVAASGSYVFPSGHTVNVGRVASCNVQISYTVEALVVGVGVVADAGAQIDVTPQIALSQDGTTWGAWQDYKPGVYTAKAFKAQVLLVSRDKTVTPQVSGLTFLVDVPDLTDSGTVTTSAGGVVHVTLPHTFNGGNTPGGTNGLPNIQLTISGASAGDDYRLTNLTTSGFDIDVVNAGSRVVRNINWVAQGW